MSSRSKSKSLGASRDDLSLSIQKVLTFYHRTDVNARDIKFQPRLDKAFLSAKYHQFSVMFLGNVTIDEPIREQKTDDCDSTPSASEETKEVIVPIAIKILTKRLLDTLSDERKLLTLEGFERELFINEVIITQLERFQQLMVRDLPYKPHFKHLFPICYGVNPRIADSENDKFDSVLVLELLNKDFVKVDPVTGLNFNNTKFIVEKIAMFHATVMSLKHSGICVFSSFPKDVSLKRIDIYSKAEVIEIMDEVNKIPALHSHRETIHSALNCSFKNRKPGDKSWRGLSHEKFSLYNIMVKLDEDKQITDCKFLDLKHITKGHILSDLVFFLTTSLSKNVLEKHFKEICNIYYETFKISGLTVNFNKALDADLSYDMFLQHLKWNFKTTLLKCIYQLKYLCCKESERENARSMADIPYLSQKDSNKYLDKKIYRQKIHQVLSELIALELIDKSAL